MKLYCSFCGRSQDEVKQLVSGGDAFICDECVDDFYDMIHGTSSFGEDDQPSRE